MPFTAVSMREESIQFNLHMHQLTLPYLLKGYYPKHSLIVATCCLAISAALTCIPTCKVGGGGDRVHQHSPAAGLLFFNSFTAFAGAVMVATMALTGLYRVLVSDNKSASTRTCGAAQQTDFLVDVLLRGTVQCVVHTLLEGSSWARAAVIFGVSAVAELGKLLGSTPAVLMTLSTLWIGYLVWSHYVPDRVKCLLPLPGGLLAVDAVPG